MLSPSRRSSLQLPPQLALTTLTHCVENLRESIQSALLEDAERTRDAWSKLQADSRQAREELREVQLQRDQAAQRAAESDDLRAAQAVELQRERERRSAAEATLRIREEAAAELRATLRAAEEALRVSEEKRQRLEVQCDDGRAALERKSEEKRGLFTELEATTREVERLRRLAPTDGGATGGPSRDEASLARGREALSWAQRVLDVLSSKVCPSRRLASLA